MWTSFTRMEKWILLWLLGLFGAGKAFLPYVSPESRSEVFQAGVAPVARSAVAAQSPPPPTSATLSGGSEAAGAPLTGVAPNGRIDLNTATLEVLDTLPGIGMSRAQAILELRAQRGGFRTVEELDDVPGIGPAAMVKLRDLVTVASAPAPRPMPTVAPRNAFEAVPVSGTVPPLPSHPPMPAQALNSHAAPAGTPAPATGRSSRPAEYSGPVNINTASLAQLETLRYVGPKLAERIILYRQRFGPFRTPQELEKVQGIGKRILAENYGRITVR